MCYHIGCVRSTRSVAIYIIWPWSWPNHIDGNGFSHFRGVWPWLWPLAVALWWSVAITLACLVALGVAPSGVGRVLAVAHALVLAVAVGRGRGRVPLAPGPAAGTPGPRPVGGGPASPPARWPAAGLARWAVAGDRACLVYCLIGSTF